MSSLETSLFVLFFISKWNFRLKYITCKKVAMSQIPSMMSYDKMITPGHMETRSWNRISLVPRSFFRTPSTSTRAFFLHINLYPTHLTPSAYFWNTYKIIMVYLFLSGFFQHCFWGIQLCYHMQQWFSPSRCNTVSHCMNIHCLSTQLLIAI